MREYRKIGGILSIVCGGFGILIGFIVGLVVLFIKVLPFEEMSGSQFPPDFELMISVVYGLMAVFYVLIGILGITAGVFGIKGHYWSLALAGAIAGTLTFYVCGIVSLIFTVLAKNEYQKVEPESSYAIPAPPPPATGSKQG